MKVVNCIEIVIKRVKRESEKLQMRFTDNKGVGYEDGRFFFPAFILRI